MKTQERESKEITRQRVPLSGQRHKLQISDADQENCDSRGVRPRWMNDEKGRVQAALAGGYKFCQPEHYQSMAGFVAVEGDNTDVGSKISKVVNRDGTRAYLMEVRKEFFNEDQQAAWDAIDEKMATILKPVDQGGQTIERGYTPK